MKNREAWLIEGIKLLTKDVFNPKGYQVPPVKVSIGFTGSSKKAIGTCWKGSAADDDIAQIFIRPDLNDSSRILDVVAHELIHAIFPNAGHKGDFRKCAKDIGLTGKMTATVAGEELKERLNDIIKIIGEIPHAKLNFNKEVGGAKKQNTRMLKAVCPSCGYTFRTSNKWLEVGLPTCSCGTKFEAA